MYLLDTTVISASDPVKRRYDAEADRWLKLHARDLYLSTISVAEVKAGILVLEKRGATARASALRHWWEELVGLYEGRILAFDFLAADAAAELSAQSGEKVGWTDLQIAAIAQSRGFSVLTLNIRDFRRIGVDCLNPFEARES